MRNQIRSRLYRWLLQATAMSERALGVAGRPDNSVREVLAGDANSTGRKICVFAHYDRHGIVDPHVQFYLGALKSAGWGIIFVTTAPHLEKASQTALTSLCRQIILRDNDGYDFASYKAGILSAGDLAACDALLIANDSVFGPLRDLGPTFDQMAGRADFWRITNSVEVAEHLQSYFICFNRPVLSDPAFHAYWRDFPLYRHKSAVIWHGEVGLSRLLIGRGHSMAALCTDSDIAAAYPNAYAKGENRSRSGQVNPSRVFWRELIEDMGAPFLKVEPVRDLADKAPEITDWQKTIALTGYDPALIEDYVRRVR